MPSHSLAPATLAKPSRALAGIRIAITRAVHQAEEQRQSLEAYGGVVFHYPCIAIAPPAEIEPLDTALQKAIAGDYDWLVVTSTNTVYALAERLRTLELTLADAPSLKVAAVGPSTAKDVQARLGLPVAALPPEFTTGALSRTIPNLNQSRILLPHSAIAESELAELLQAQGASVDAVTAYRTMVAQAREDRTEDDVPGMLWEGTIDAITFTSGSTVRNFSRRLSVEQASLDMLDHVCVACIGPSTADVARQFGLSVDVMPEEHTIQGMTDALIAHFEKANR